MVKFASMVEEGIAGLAYEYICFRLARKLGIQIPDAAGIQVPVELAEVADGSGLSDCIRGNKYLCFGSRHLKPVITDFVADKVKQIPLDDMALIFAFDALVYNTDRRQDNANLLLHRGKTVVIDHEKAFSFDIGNYNSKEPWRVFSAAILQDHVFFRVLRKRQVQFDGIQQKLNRIKIKDIESIMNSLPQDWNPPSLILVKAHLAAMLSNVNGFILELRRVLS